MARRLSRITKHDPPELSDFASNRAKGLTPRGREIIDPTIYDAISVWARRSDAELMALRYPKTGDFIAELDIPDDGSVRLRQTGAPGHFSVWADPDLLRTLVVSVTPVRR